MRTGRYRSRHHITPYISLHPGSVPPEGHPPHLPVPVTHPPLVGRSVPAPRGDFPGRTNHPSTTETFSTIPAPHPNTTNPKHQSCTDPRTPAGRSLGWTCPRCSRRRSDGQGDVLGAGPQAAFLAAAGGHGNTVSARGPGADRSGLRRFGVQRMVLSIRSWPRSKRMPSGLAVRVVYHDWSASGWGPTRPTRPAP